MTRDEQLWIVSATADNEPGESYLFNRPEKKLTLQYHLFQNLDREQLTTTQAIRYRSSDGLEIPAYLTLPKGLPAKNLPTVVFPHGGPWLRDSWGFNPFWQLLANRGYAVLSPNFRGSAGYGKDFLNTGNKQWGEKMQDDLTWGVKYLVAQGITDPKRVGIMGGSYGGYATLAGVAFTPEIYAAAVSFVGPSNLITLAESLPPYWEGSRKTFYVRMGDPSKPEGKAQLRRQSPVNSAFRIRTPLLIVHGANDPRVNRAESDQIVIALRDRGFPVEYLLAPDEGHGFARPVNRMAMIASAEKFLARYLGGHFQENMPSEVATRLKEITVDPKTVVGSSSVLSSKGIQSLDSGNVDEAISFFSKAIEINPKYSEAYLNRGNAYRRKGQYDQAISDYNKALEINPRSDEAHYHRGVAHCLKKEYGKSWEDINKAQDLGYKIPAEFLEELRKASGRQK
jgi:dienelactone hydrolase